MDSSGEIVDHASLEFMYAALDAGQQPDTAAGRLEIVILPSAPCPPLIWALGLKTRQCPQSNRCSHSGHRAVMMSRASRSCQFENGPAIDAPWWLIGGRLVPGVTQTPLLADTRTFQADSAADVNVVL